MLSHLILSLTKPIPPFPPPFPPLFLLSSSWASVTSPAGPAPPALHSARPVLYGLLPAAPLRLH